MNVEARPDPAEEMRDWWRTDIIEMKPGVIRFRGYAIEDLIGRVGFTQMIWLLLRGELPDPGQAMLLDNALMSGVDHGPQAPSIAIARMAATCGVGLNNAMATAVNVLGDVHGGAGEQAVRLFDDILRRMEAGADEVAATEAGLAEFTRQHGKIIPGFGHRFHPIDPRSPRLLELVDEATAAGVVAGQVRADCAADRGRAGAAERTPHPDEHRRLDRRHLRRAGIPRSARARPVLPVAIRRHTGARMGADATGRPQQGSDSAPIHSLV